MIIEQKDDGNKVVYRKFLSFLVSSLLIGGLILVYIYFNISGSNDKITLVRLEQMKQDLEKEKRELRVNIEYLSSPDQIEMIVKNRLGMMPVTGERSYVVRVPGR